MFPGRVRVMSSYEYSVIWVDLNHMFNNRVRNPQPEHDLFNK